MSFLRNFDSNNIDRMTGKSCSDVLSSQLSFSYSGIYLKLDANCNFTLFTMLKADVLKGEVFPAVRQNELHFYYKGGCLYKFAGGSFKRDKNFEKFGVGFENLHPYEKAKRENEIKFKNAAGGEAERQLLDKLYCHTFNPEKKSKVVVLDIEVNLGGQAVRKCDMVLLNTQTDELMFVEGKVFSDSRVLVANAFIPEVIAQVNTYSAAIAEQHQNILEQYARYVEIINGLFGTAYRVPKILVEPAKLLVYRTPHNPTKNGIYSIDKINAELGADNVLWVMADENLALDEIWDCLKNKL